MLRGSVGLHKVCLQGVSVQLLTRGVCDCSGMQGTIGGGVGIGEARDSPEEGTRN